MSDFRKGQQVVHCREGLAFIVDQTSISGNDYFVVHINRGSGENIYVPMAKADAIIRPLLTKEEADKLVEYMKGVGIEFNPNTKQRRDMLKRRLGSGDVHDIANLFKQYYFYKTVTDGSVRFGPVDLDMLEFAKNNLLDEFAISYGKDRDSIEAYIFELLSKK